MSLVLTLRRQHPAEIAAQLVARGLLGRPVTLLHHGPREGAA